MEYRKNKLVLENKKRVLVAARKSLMVANENYHAWSPQEQECFRATMDDKSRDKIRLTLLKSLMDIKCSPEDVGQIWEDIPISELNVLNWASLLTSGIGEDFIYLNESLAEGKSLLDYKTLYDYDYDDYLFQEQANHQDIPEYKDHEYYAYRHPSWVRLLIQEHFYYGTLTSLATFLTDDIETTGIEYISKLIPHEYIDGKNHLKREDAGFLWDMKIDAGGQEGQLDELKSRWYSYLQEHWLGLSKRFRDLPAAVYIKDQDWNSDPHHYFIFNNANTLKKIRWRQFMSDCEPLIAEFSTVSKQLTLDVEKAESWLVGQYEDIMENFDPNIVKFRKKRKIVFSDKAMEDFNRFSSEDDNLD